MEICQGCHTSTVFDQAYLVLSNCVSVRINGRTRETCEYWECKFQAEFLHVTPKETAFVDLSRRSCRVIDLIQKSNFSFESSSADSYSFALAVIFCASSCGSWFLLLSSFSGPHHPLFLSSILVLIYIRFFLLALIHFDPNRCGARLPPEALLSAEGPLSYDVHHDVHVPAGAYPRIPCLCGPGFWSYRDEIWRLDLGAIW
ncbi:hypothetical protein PSPO01_03132 [Paraphaeosphaeria sporulosa]